MQAPAVIPRRSNEPPDPFFDREAYRERNQLKRLIGRPKQDRRIATRYEKLAVSSRRLSSVIAATLLRL